MSKKLLTDTVAVNLDVVFEAKMCFIILLRPAGVFIFLAAFVDIIRP
jgi:hypothetical protein